MQKLQSLATKDRRENRDPQWLSQWTGPVWNHFTREKPCIAEIWKMFVNIFQYNNRSLIFWIHCNCWKQWQNFFIVKVTLNVNSHVCTIFFSLQSRKITDNLKTRWYSDKQETTKLLLQKDFAAFLSILIS